MRIKGLIIIAGLLCATQAKTQTDTLSQKKDTLFNELKENLMDNIPTVTVDENDQGDAGGQNISSVLSAGRDPYYSSASFNWNISRFRLRGYNNDEFGTYLNGVPMDNLDNGFTPYGLWGGLNDVMRNRDVSFGLRTNTFAFGEIGSITNIDVRASRQRAQTSISYSASNRNYNNRILLTHSTGLNKKGWAFTISGSRRWAGEGYVPGTYYDGWGYFAAIDKKLGAKHLLSLTAFGAPTESGRQGAAVQEMMDLAGSNYYNPNWGYQNGKKRNASVAKGHQPVILLNHDFRINNNTTLATGVGYSFGDRSVSALEWYASDPRPDYYRYLPSYFNSPTNQDPYQYKQLYDLLSTNEQYRQINWDRFFDVNRASIASIPNANGIQGNTVTGKRSLYIVENRIVNTQRININTVLNTRLSNNIDFTSGLSYQHQKNHYYKTVDDLLGGEFYVNINRFAERDFPSDNVSNQWDADHPNGIVKEGDKFGYDYNINLTKAAGWAQGVFKYNKVDFFLAGELSHTSFFRYGNVRTGLFLDDSYGKSSVNNFTNYSVKGGITLKLDGRNYLYVNGGALTKAPFFENVYVSPRTRDSKQENTTSEKIQTIEGGYLFNAPKLRVRISGYYTQYRDGMDVMSFYHDGVQNFVNYALSGIDKVHFGGEFGVEAKITPTISINAAASVGRYYYNSRQTAVVTSDNSAEVLVNNQGYDKITIYSENFRVPSTPQEAYSLGVSYRSPKFWFISLTGNYFDQSWLSFNPVRRTSEAVDGVSYKNDTWHNIIDQEKFKGAFTMDLFGGYSYLLPKKYSVAKKRTFLVLNAGVNNLLNKQDIITGGYEQLRFDYETKDINKFPPKYFYAFGINFFASITLRF